MKKIIEKLLRTEIFTHTKALKQAVRVCPVRGEGFLAG
jgi:hypothetical protein